MQKPHKSGSELLAYIWLGHTQAVAFVFGIVKPVQEVPTVVPAAGQIMRQESEQLSQSCSAGRKI